MAGGAGRRPGPKSRPRRRLAGRAKPEHTRVAEEVEAEEDGGEEDDDDDEEEDPGDDDDELANQDAP